MLNIVVSLQDYLLHCLQLCVSKFYEWQEQREEGGGGEGKEVVGETPELLEEGRKTLGSLVERMIKSEPEDFELVHVLLTIIIVVLLLGQYLIQN